MNIIFAGVTVCTGVGTDSPDRFDYAGEEDEQVSKFLRATSAVVRERYNETTQIAFTLFKSLGTEQAAEAFCLAFRQPSYLPKYGTLVLKSGTKQSAGGVALYLPNAHFKRGKVSYKGMNVFVEFNFSGGAMQTNKPTGT